MSPLQKKPRPSTDLSQPAVPPRLWTLDRRITFLNHGSFGSCPRAVLAAQQACQRRIERQPVHFFVRDLEPLLDKARKSLAEFLGANASDLAFVPNATAGVNTVLRSLSFRRGDELLVTDHEYNATRNALNFAAERSGARVKVARIPFPLKGADEILHAVMQAVTSRTRLALLDHVTSQTALILPIERLIRMLADRGIETLVDGAHAPGMIPLNLGKLGAAYYTGNCHKWLCAPKGAGFLWVHPDRQSRIQPLSISHGANSLRRDRSRFLIEFGWTGTADSSASLCIPESIEYLRRLVPGGWREIMARNRRLALEARSLLCQALEIPLPCPDEQIGSMAALPLGGNFGSPVTTSPLYLDPLQDALLEDHGIEVPVIPWPDPASRVLRVSAQLYNSLPQYQRLAGALARYLKKSVSLPARAWRGQDASRKFAL